MPIGKQPFELPINAVKKETSLQEKILIQSHEEDGTPTFFEKVVDRRVHTKGVKVKFFVVGYRILQATVINYVGKWVELEAYQFDYLPPTETVPYSYMLGFYPYINTPDELILRFQLFPLPAVAQRGELYIEKFTVIDSDFDSSLSWLTDDTIPEIIPNPNKPFEPDPPFGIDPDPNNIWIFTD